MEVKNSSFHKPFYHNKYLEYRELVESSKGFSSRLDQAKAPEAPKTRDPQNSKALASNSDSDTSTISKEGDTITNENQASLAEAPLNVRIPDNGAAGGRMMDKVQEFEPYIRAAANRYNLPPELIAGLIWQESRGNPRAVSHCGAKGLTQLMPATAINVGVTNVFDPAESIDGGAKYLRQMLDKFGRIEFAVAAYNSGPGNVSKFGGIPPFAETQDYVPKVLGFANSFKVAGAFQQMTTPTAVRV